MFYYTDYGWLTSNPNPERSTSVVPPTETDTLKANWTGLAWVLVEYVAPPAPPAPVVVKPTLSPREFLKRFTPQEYATIKAATSANAVIDYYWQQLILASFVDLDDPDTIGGVQALESTGLIAAGRAAEILA